MPDVPGVLAGVLWALLLLLVLVLALRAEEGVAGVPAALKLSPFCFERGVFLALEGCFFDDEFHRAVVPLDAFMMATNICACGRQAVTASQRHSNH